MRTTQIIATIGPATETVAAMQQLLECGVDIFRFNFSHGEYAWFETTFAHAREAAEKTGKDVKIMMDTAGPEIRTGDIDAPLELQKGDIVTFTTLPVEQDVTQKIIAVNYPGILSDVSEHDIIELDNGLFEAKVLSESDTDFTVEILSDGVLGSRKHINLPGIRVGLPTISQEDEKDIAFALNLGIDMIAVSFVRTPEDIQLVQKLCSKKGATNVQIYGKIENAEGVENFDTILQAADGVMVARGDLGIELPFEQIPSLQKAMLKQAHSAKKFSIVATQMLESMVQSPRPTRAEVTDVSTAVWEQAGAVMLSAETAVGKYPFRAVEVMKRIICFAEKEREGDFQ